MRIGDGHRQRVGRIGPGHSHAGQQHLQHRLYLRFLGSARADDGFLAQSSKGVIEVINPEAGLALFNKNW